MLDDMFHCGKKKFLLIVTGGRIINQMLCRHGGTGRRAGLKIPFWQQSAGSIPAGGIFSKALYFQRKRSQPLEIQGFFDVQTEYCVPAMPNGKTEVEIMLEKMVIEFYVR